MLESLVEISNCNTPTERDSSLTPFDKISKSEDGRYTEGILSAGQSAPIIELYQSTDFLSKIEFFDYRIMFKFHT
jgi:hypothetical protein